MNTRMKIKTFAILLIMFLGCNIIKAQDHDIKSSKVPKEVKDSLKKYYPFVGEVDWKLVDGKYVALYGFDRSILLNANGKVIAEKNTVLLKIYQKEYCKI